MEYLAERLASRLSEITYEALPEDVIQVAKRCVLDQLGIQVFGATLAHTQPALGLARAVRCAPQATIAYHGDRTSPSYAAYANAAFGHSCELDDTHFLAGHPGVCTIPVAFALAETTPVHGKEFIASIVAGFESMVLSCATIHRATLMLGWHGTKVAGVFASAATAAHLLGLGPTKTVHALSVAASDASGTMEYDQTGGEVKRLHAALPARAGLEAALLADLGMTGPPSILEGKRGIYKLFGDGSPPAIEQYWDVDFHIRDTMFKLYPSVGITHAPLDALRSLRSQHGFGTEDIASIKVGVSEWARPHLGTVYEPMDAVTAQFSLPFAVGLELVLQKSQDVRWYLDPKMWSDERILEAAKLVEVYAMAFEPGAPESGARMHITLKDGAELEMYQRAPSGHAENPASESAIVDKFLGLVNGLLPSASADQVIEQVFTLETADDVGSLMQLVTGTRK